MAESQRRLLVAMGHYLMGGRGANLKCISEYGWQHGITYGLGQLGVTWRRSCLLRDHSSSPVA